MRIVSFGSLNVDVTVRVPHLPAADETLHVHGVQQFLGGKGANQAVAAARLGAEVAMVGSIGSDPQGDTVLRGMIRHGIDLSQIRRVDGATGTAIPIVTDSGEVSILVAAGANAATDASQADAARDLITRADVLLIQGEVPGVAAGRAAAIASEADTVVIFNPAPVNDVVEHVMGHATIVVANQVEAAEIQGRMKGQDLIVTLGARGARVNGTDVAGFPAQTVDPTGAGDAFAGALAVAASEGSSLEDMVRFANAAGSCAVEVPGAEPSMPSRDQVTARMNHR